MLAVVLAMATPLSRRAHRSSPSRCRPRVKSAPTTVTRAVQGRDRSFYQWVDDEGISAPCIGIGYVGGGIPDANETYRGCIVTNPIASGDVLVRCPSHLALALPPSPPNPFPDFVPDEVWNHPPGSGRRAQDFRMAIVLLRERLLGDASRWEPYLRQLPESYDLLGMWTDEQLVELHSPRLRAAAEDQRQENRAAFEALAAAGPRCGCASLTDEDVTWALNTVRSRSFPGEYPTTGSAPHPFADSAAADVASRTGAEHEPPTFVLPLLDALNHSADGEAATKLRYVAGDDGEDGGAFELLSARDLDVGDEATISYGALDNDELLLRFGFCVDDSADERVPLPGCTDELEWVMPGSAREGDLYAEGLDAAVRGAHLDREGFASENLLWALRVLLASDEEYEAAGGAKGLRAEPEMGMNGVTGDGGVVVGSAAQLAAEASLALACEQELEAMGGAATLEEDVLTLAAASAVLSEVEEECEPCDAGDEACVDPNPERCGIDGEEGNDSEYLRRLVAALSYRTNRKRILQAALRRYSPLHEPLVKSGDELYNSDYDEKVG